MLELLTNMIVWTALGGSVLIIIIVVVKAVATLAGRASMPETSPVLASKQRTCRYCGMVLGEEHKCLNCGAVEQSIGKTKGFKQSSQ
jgi:hypothetical protein